MDGAMRPRFLGAGPRQTVARRDDSAPGAGDKGRDASTVSEQGDGVEKSATQNLSEDKNTSCLLERCGRLSYKTPILNIKKHPYSVWVFFNIYQKFATCLG